MDFVYVVFRCDKPIGKYEIHKIFEFCCIAEDYIKNADGNYHYIFEPWEVE